MEVVNSGEKFESDDLSYTKAVIGEKITLNDSEQKVLGQRWDSIEDELSISLKRLSCRVIPCCQQSVIY